MPKLLFHQVRILAKEQVHNSYTFWAMSILIFSPVYFFLRHPLLLYYFWRSGFIFKPLTSCILPRSGKKWEKFEKRKFRFQKKKSALILIPKPNFGLTLAFCASFFSPERKSERNEGQFFFSQNPILRSTPRKARQKNRTVVESLGEEEEEDFNIENDNQQAQSENNEYAIRYRCEISGFLVSSSSFCRNERFLSFLSLYIFLRKVCLFFNFLMIKRTVMLCLTQLCFYHSKK